MADHLTETRSLADDGKILLMAPYQGLLPRGLFEAPILPEHPIPQI